LEYDIGEVESSFMETVQRIQQLEQLKIVADARRMAILKLLMVQPETLTSLGKHLGEHPARVRHHLKKLEKAGLVELVDTQVVRGFTEKYYAAAAQAFTLNEIILPENARPDTILVLGSHDLALELLSKEQDKRSSNLMALAVGSLNGLIALRQGNAHIASCHLLDAQSGEYNTSFVRHFFPDQTMRLITLANREQGLLVAPGNPLQLKGLEDLERKGLKLINRNPGSGTRIWLDQQLNQMGFQPESISGYNREVRTHTAVAEIIAKGSADLGIGLRAAADQHGLDFIPLFEERFDLVLSQTLLTTPKLQPILDRLQSSELRQKIRNLAGYHTDQTGNEISP
jgi:putative molybdopterin biosynthesis protein